MSATDNETYNDNLMADYYEEMGIDHREWHNGYVRIRSGDSYGRRAVYVKLTTLSDAVRIEKLRWRSLLAYHAHCARSAKLMAEIHAQPDNECFVPTDAEEIEQQIEKESVTDEEASTLRRWAAHPRRIAVRRERYERKLVMVYDDRFWDYEPEDHQGTDFEVLAAAGALGEWEQITLPARVKRSEDPAKLDLGARWQQEEIRGRRLLDRFWVLNEILATSILRSEIFKDDSRRTKKRAHAVINGRRYPFHLEAYGHVSADYDTWPSPNSAPDVEIDSPLTIH